MEALGCPGLVESGSWDLGVVSRWRASIEPRRVLPTRLTVRSEDGCPARLTLVVGCDRHNARHLTELGDPRGTPVSDPGRGQFWAGPPSAVDAALAALAASYTVAWHRPVRTRTTWLDSIDLRLYRNGMALTAVEGPGGSGCMLTLSRTDG